MEAQEEPTPEPRRSIFSDTRFTTPWIAAGAIGAIATAIITAVIFLLSLHLYVSSAPSTWESLAETIVSGIALLVVALLVTSMVVTLFRRPPPPRQVVLPWTVQRALTLVDRIRESWSAQSQHLASLTFVARSIQSALVSPTASGATMTPDETVGKEQFLVMVYGFVQTGQTPNNSISMSSFILRNFSANDSTPFFLAVDMLDLIVQDGIRLANSMCEAARRSGVVRWAPHVRDEWVAFRDKANRLSEDLTTFHREVTQAMGMGLVPYFEPVRELQ